ncbi:MAG TPA: diacylglycerol kinase family protein [Solirubrobacteraceae bacterium]|nr:diacylglycerol kinase family protein [Solirubrobacteraceae bacterium]
MALVLTLAAVGLAIGIAVANFPNGLTVLACGVAALCAAWYGLRRRGLARTAGAAAAVLLICGAIVLIIVEGRVLADVLVLAAIGGGLAAARQAFQVHADLPRAPRPDHPVLFYNPLSGGGKAQRFHLADEARRRGIEPIELKRGDDLETLVRDAVRGGADALAMAGGDGSQAIVAMVAAELDLPYACIPSGTRNHFALDLGVDRDDVVGALDAFVNGGERRVDLAEVNGRVFVNNVSLGLYADAVQRPGYREAKLHTLLDTVPDVLGPEAQVPDLRWRGGRGEESAVAILVSNNAYRLGRALGSGTRPRLDRGELGITVLAPILVDANGGASRRLTMRQWTTPTFEIKAESSVAAGIDGEAAHLQAPLRFSIRPGALRVRIAPDHPGASPSALEPDRPWQAIESLATFVVHGAPAGDFEADRSPHSGDDQESPLANA